MASEGGAVYNTRYQVLLVTLLSLNFGIVFFDRNAISFLAPFIKPDLGLNYFEVGLLASGLSLTWALAALVIGIISDKTGSRKGILIVATIAFSLCSFLSGIASSFALLLGARLLMGFSEGPIMPISQTMLATEVSPERRGLAMGVAQNFGSNLLGSFAAPVLLVAFATTYSWHHAFFLAGIPGLITAVLMWWFIKEPEPTASAGSGKPRLSMLEALSERNILICSAQAVLLVSYLVICWNFMPLYLTNVRHFQPDRMSWLMGTLGISATVGSFVISGISDYVGRKPVMIIMPFIGIILGAMFFHGHIWIMYVIFFVGWGLNGIFPLFMATVPSESVDPLHTATVVGLCMGLGEILGGVLSPSLAGYAGDLAGPQAPLWIMFALTIIAGFLAIGLRETAPRFRNANKI